MLQNLRTKENDKNLATQKLHYLKEKETNLNEFLNRAEEQVKPLEIVLNTHNCKLPMKRINSLNFLIELQQLKWMLKPKEVYTMKKELQ
jgi:mevalonate kinase